MEGVASEAASLAGHLRLRKLICLYDDNGVTLAGSANLTFTEDRLRRFDAYGWKTLSVADGNDIASIDAALQAARAETSRPTLIAVRTHIGYGSPHKQDTFEAHGSPLGVEEVRLTKERLGWPTEPAFLIPEQALSHFREAVARGERAEAEWNDRMASYARAFPDLAQEVERSIRGDLPAGWDANIPSFPADAKGSGHACGFGPRDECDRASAADADRRFGRSESFDSHRARRVSATLVRRQQRFSGRRRLSYAGRNIHFGVREHAMGAITNGLAAHGGTLPYGATFLIFSDYMRPPIRLAALMKLHVIHVFTHDSIALGEDGPTHQPVEQLAVVTSDPQCDRHQARRCQRNRGRMASGVRGARPSGLARADPAVRAHARSTAASHRLMGCAAVRTS